VFKLILFMGTTFRPSDEIEEQQITAHTQSRFIQWTRRDPRSASIGNVCLNAPNKKKKVSIEFAALEMALFTYCL
jgi:hypothetical protein